VVADARSQEGTADEPGVNIRALRQVFHEAEARKMQGSSYRFKVSLFEIYNETIRDLLQPVRPTTKDSMSKSAAALAASKYPSNNKRASEPEIERLSETLVVP